MRELLCLLGIWAAAMSLAAFCAMGFDKRRARRGGRRVPEKTLLMLALLGGSPGAVAGMHCFRHKTRHWYFRWGLPAILLLQCAALAFLLCRR